MFRWYVFDMVIVVVSVFSIGLEHVNLEREFVNPTAVKAMRLLRVVRGNHLLASTIVTIFPCQVSY